MAAGRIGDQRRIENERMTDPTDRIVRLVIAQIGRTPLDDVAKRYTIDRVTIACRVGIASEFLSWHKARCEITKLEEEQKQKGEVLSKEFPSKEFLQQVEEDRKREMSDKVPQQQNQCSRENAAVAVFRDRAERLHKRGDALNVLASLIELQQMTKADEELLWSLAVGTQDF